MKPKDDTSWYKINPLQVPAHYLMHDGAEISRSLPGDAGVMAYIMGLPDADAAKSNITGQPSATFGKVQQAKNLSKTWYAGMLIGPVVLFLVLGIAAEVPRMATSAMLLGSDSMWLTCGRFALPPRSCTQETLPGGSSANTIIVKNCECLQCSDYKPVSSTIHGYNNKVCAPLMGGCNTEFGSCFGFHSKDFEMYQDLAGFCHCGMNEGHGTMEYNNTVQDMAQKNYIWSDQWLTNGKHTIKFMIWHQWHSPPPALMIMSSEWAWAKLIGGDVNNFLHYLFVDTVLAYYAFAITKTKVMMTWLSAKFYKADTFLTGIGGFVGYGKSKNQTQSTDDVQIGVLAGRAAIATAVGGMTAMHHH